MNIMQVLDNQGNLTWVEVTPKDKTKTKEPDAPSKLPTVEQMFENRPSLTSLLEKRPAHLCSERDGFMDTLLFAGVTLAMILVSVIIFNQSIPIDTFVPIVFLIMLILHLFIYKSQEKNDLEFQKQWINQQAISAKLKTKYREDIDLEKSNIIWLVIRFCLFVSLAVVIAVLISPIFDDKKSNG
jgi:hypothetical protein